MMPQLCLTAALLAGAADFDAQTLDGKSAVGQLVELNDQQVVLQTAEGRSTFALAALATLTRQGTATPEDRRATLWVELVDGSGLAATEYTAQGGTATVTLSSAAKLEIPTRAIRWVRFGPPADRDAKLAKQWSDVTETNASGDLLVVRKNGALDYLEGVQGDVDAETCKFELDKELVPVKRPKVEGVVYFHATAAALPEAIGQLLALDGSHVSLRTATLDDGAVKVTTPGGLSASWPLDQITRLDFTSGKIAYLSDLKPESASYVPFLGFKADVPSLADFYAFRRDESFEQNPLRMDGKIYRKGLALQSRTVLSYKLPGKFRVFNAVVGIDDSVRDAGSVHLEIKGDGKTLWKGEVRGSEPARALELELGSTKRLEIVADFGEDLDIGDRLDLADARVMK
jgi:hypothetical protein